MAMGGKGCSNVVAESSIPAYCIKMLGSRHILIGGGGGSAKTGVLNQIQLFLLTYASEFNLNTGKCQPGPLRAQLSSTVDTGEYSNMNMDCIVLDAEPERGRYLIAAGQDQFCALYETTGFCINQQDGEASTGGLAFDFRNCIRIETDKRASGEDSYQKCVRLFRAAPQNNNQNIKMLTAGTDGCIRLWTVGQLLAAENRQPKPSTTAKTSDELDELQLVDAVHELEIPTGKSAVEEMDVSPCGQLLATVLPQSTILWALNTGEKLFTLPMEGGPGELISNKFKIRTLRFTGLDRTGKCAIFVTGHNQRVRRSKEVSHIALWSYAKERRTGRLLQSRQACKASISCLEMSPCSQFVAFGTMDGSVGIVDTQSLRPLLFLRETHCSFVTALAFLPPKSYDIKDLGRIDDKSQSPNLPPGRCFLPGICASSRAAVVSISVDKRIMVHQLAFPSPSTFTGYLLQISLFAALLYSMFWAIFIYTNH